MIDRTTLRPFGQTGLTVSPICAGAAELGDMTEEFGYAVTEEAARLTVEAVLRGPLNFLDTAAAYGDGKSERRIGEAIRGFGGLPSGFVLATKADRELETGDFSGDQARRSVERSLRLLGQTRLDLVYLHDLENARHDFGEITGKNGALEALLALQQEGAIAHLGYAGTGLGLTDRYLSTGAFSVVITHNQLTLLNQSAAPWIAKWARSVAVVNAAPYAGGILARGAAHARYMYRAAPVSVIRRAREIEAACASYGVPVAAAALQFSTRHPGVSATIVGMSKPERVDETLRLESIPIPAGLWTALGQAGSYSA